MFFELARPTSRLWERRFNKVIFRPDGVELCNVPIRLTEDFLLLFLLLFFFFLVFFLFFFSSQFFFSLCSLSLSLDLSLSRISCHVCLSAFGSRGGRKVPPIHACTPTAPLSFFFYLSFPLVLKHHQSVSLHTYSFHFSLDLPGTA